MKYFSLLILFSSIVLSSCGHIEERQIEELSEMAEAMEEAAEAMEEMTEEPIEGPQFVTNFDKPSEDIPDACIPIMSDLFNDEPNRSLYDYLLKYLDTIGPRTVEYRKDWETGLPTDEICGFSQEFTNGVIYHKSECGEAGESMGLQTMCNSKDILYYVVNGLFTDPEGVWNADSTEYGPYHGEAGCYYNILMEDGHYSLGSYCGC